jgi:hypothetical protein
VRLEWRHRFEAELQRDDFGVGVQGETTAHGRKDNRRRYNALA